MRSRVRTIVALISFYYFHKLQQVYESQCRTRNVVSAVSAFEFDALLDVIECSGVVSFNKTRAKGRRFWKVLLNVQDHEIKAAVSDVSVCKVFLGDDS